MVNQGGIEEGGKRNQIDTYMKDFFLSRRRLPAGVRFSRLLDATGQPSISGERAFTRLTIFDPDQSRRRGPDNSAH